MSKITIETINYGFGIEADVKSEVTGNIMEFIAVMTAINSLRANLIKEVEEKLNKIKKDGKDIPADYQSMIDKLIKGQD